jgi:hypothetical protein
VLEKAEAEQAERRHRDPGVAAGDPGGVLEDVLAEEHEPERSEPEVDPLHAAGDRTEQRAREPGQQHGRDQREHGRDVLGQVAVAVRADGDEERVGERQLAGDADQQRQPDRGHHRRHREQRRLEPEALQVERQGGQHHDRRDRGAQPKHG